ncbi:MAG TPA: hypothetical protein DIT13_02470 [Verrucomicrobiales bacterium]|nr:hypothetical protein [Verrucomicrobiales bacterium]HRJ10666.1 hypothetical protein [Prosthecobacter sp.]HRK16530.1 hypothetical protein [Prosthecobacter sp.]
MSTNEDTASGRGAPAGNQNAAKDDGYDTVLRIRCHAADKGGWKLKAERAGLDLSEWIRTRLNRARD